MKCEITRLALITGAVLLGAAEASRGWEAVLPVTGLDHVQQHGPSGAGIWSSPTIDEQPGVLYIATGRRGDCDSRRRAFGALDGHLRAYSASTGEVLWDTDTAREFETVNGKPTHGGSLDAVEPAGVKGMVFFNSGYNQFDGMPGNVLLAYSVDGK